MIKILVWIIFICWVTVGIVSRISIQTYRGKGINASYDYGILDLMGFISFLYILFGDKT